MSALAMFRKSTKDGDIRKAAQKVADPKKDTLTRLKHLRTVLDNYDTTEAKKFFEENYSHIYYIFFDNFVNVEADLKQRANKSHREELDSILNIFEKILLLLPELVHKRWMFHSIGRIMKKLLHPGNGLKLRRDGLRLFLIWYQILQENASVECHNIFLQLVTGLGDGVQQDILNNHATVTLDAIGAIISAGEVTPILPVAGEKQPDNITRFFFDALLQFMVSEVIKVEWLNKDMREISFVFLFKKFKSSYLKWLLPDFDRTRSIYDPVLDLPSVRESQSTYCIDEPENVSECRDSFIRWITTFTISTFKKDPETLSRVGVSAMSEGEMDQAEDVEKVEQKGDTLDHGANSNTSTLSTGSQCTEKDSTNSSFCSEEHSTSEYEIVRTALYSNRENINIVHEVFRQALLFSFKHGAAIRRVIAVYKDWFQHDLVHKPIFMLDPSEPVFPLGLPGTPSNSLSDILEEDGSTYSEESAPSSLPLHLSRDSGDFKTWLRNASYLGAITDLADGGDLTQIDVRAGQQKVLQVFITNASNIFLLQAQGDEALLEQIDLCKRVLNIYRHMVMKIHMEQKTWEQMLRVLLCITAGVLNSHPPDNRHSSLGGRLAQPIFQTLIVTWIKANLKVFISAELWDLFMKTLSSLTSWAELIQEWAKTVETLTRVMAKQVYNLDLHDLPLERLSEQKEKRRRGRSQEIPKSKLDEKNFARAWSKSVSENQTGEDQHPSSNSHQTSFERKGKYKSDGAGGSKSRPDLGKQRSLSGSPSPGHSRSVSASSDLTSLVRSSSEGNLNDSTQTADHLTQSIKYVDQEGEVHNSDHELLPCDHHDASMDVCTENSIASDTDTVTRRSRSVSPGSVQYRSCSRTPSPTPSSELLGDLHSQHKDSPTPDRDSLHIEMVASNVDTTINRGSLEEFKSVLAGGMVQDWLPDVSVILWRRMLGALGDVNKIEDPAIHASVFQHLCELQSTLIRMRNNLGVTPDNQSSPSPPEFIPPQRIFAPWLFECLNLSNKYKKGKLLAYQLLCQMMVRHHDLFLPSELLAQFYLVIHQGLISSDQDVKNVIVRYSGAWFFSSALPGNSVLILDLINACESVINSIDIKETPRVEALSILGSLICFPNNYTEIPVLHGDMETVNLSQDRFKDRLISLLLKAGKKEPSGLARCIAVNSLGIFLYEELSHGLIHTKCVEAINVLLGALRCIDRVVAKMASDMLTLLCDHVEKLLDFDPGLPKKIVEVISCTISVLIPLHEGTISEEEKKLLVSMMCCVVEWCLKIPIQSLLETSDTHRGCLFEIFQMLNIAVTGHKSDSLQQASRYLLELWQDPDFDNLREVNINQRMSTSDSGSSLSSEKSKSSPDTAKRLEMDTVKLGARTLMNHLVNYLCHFPMGIGASRVTSSVVENMDTLESEDIKSDIFNAPNVQFFVLNQKTLISFIELPALLDLPGGGVTAGLTTAQTVCRVILRDMTGKYCWESSVLYGPPWCSKGSYLKDAKTLHGLTANIDLETLFIKEDTDLAPPDVSIPRSPSEIPMFETTLPQQDNLNDLLGYIGHTSPECLLFPGIPLNIDAPLPEDLNEDAEVLMSEMLLQQKESELQYYNNHRNDASMLAKPQLPSEILDPVSPFQMCRMFLDQLGMLSWEKRCNFDLLKKTDKLLRELKNLDLQKCRETHKFAVIYVAEGQEDKNSILSNHGGSTAFEQFISGLGWEVDLETHKGFLGGLQQNHSTGDTAPYYATSSCEILYHVSTRIPSGNEESRHVKMRHLGNDEVHIVWSEHVRDYRRGIIPTDFGDVLIIIYPLPSGLYRIHIDRKPEIPLFGPLFDGAIVDQLALPGLVRASAINASRVIRAQKQFYHAYFEERAKCLDTVIQQHMEHTVFEQFAASCFAPVLPPNSTISDSASDNSISIPSSNSQSEISRLSESQVSPSSTRQSKDGAGSFTDLFRI